jgi:FkbM family methyltransferase
MKIGLTLKHLLNRFGYDIKYHRPFYETVVAPLNPRIILDIGANDGHYTHSMRERFPDAHVYAFEPLQECYARLAAHTTGDAHITTFNCALGENNETATIHKSSFHPSSSLLPMADAHKRLYPKSAGSTTETITVRRLDDIPELSQISGPMVVKIDVQGFEDRVIKGGLKTLAKASVIIAETAYTPLYEGQALFGDVHTLLASLGFRYHGAAERHFDKKGYPLYEDAVFINTSLSSEVA